MIPTRQLCQLVRKDTNYQRWIADVKRAIANNQRGVGIGQSYSQREYCNSIIGNMLHDYDRPEWNKRMYNENKRYCDLLTNNLMASLGIK